MSTETPRPRSALKRLLLLPLGVIATVLVVFDDLFRSFIRPAIQWVASLRLVRRLEAAVAALPPYAVLALFLIPMAVIWPIKLYALYLIGVGQWALGMGAFAVAKVLGSASPNGCSRSSGQAALDRVVRARLSHGDRGPRPRPRLSENDALLADSGQDAEAGPGWVPPRQSEIARSRDKPVDGQALGHSEDSGSPSARN